MSDIKNWKKIIENIQLNETDAEDVNYTDHEVSMAKSQLLSSVKSSTRIAKHLSNTSEDDGIPGWVASKLTVAEDYLQAVADYMDGEELQEGWSELPRIDREKYQKRDGLEGPIQTKSGKVVYYDPKEGSYYDPDTDMYISYDDWRMLDSGNMHKIDVNELTIDDVKKATAKAKKRQEKERKDTGKSSVSTADLAARLKEESKELNDLKSIVHNHLSQSFSDASDSGANKEQFADYMMNAIDELIDEQIDDTFENNLKKTNDPLTLAIRNEIDAIIEFSNLNKGDAESVAKYVSDMIRDIAEEWEDMQKEGNEFSGALADAKKSGKKEFEVDGKKYKIKEAENETKYGIVRYPDTAISYIKNDGNGWEHIYDRSYGFKGPVAKADLKHAKKIAKEKIPSRMINEWVCGDCSAEPCQCNITEGIPKDTTYGVVVDGVYIAKGNKANMRRLAKEKDGQLMNAPGKKVGDKTASVNESTEMNKEHSPSVVKQAVAIASKMGGNMTGATAAIEKMSPGLSKHPQVAAVLKRANESQMMSESQFDEAAGEKDACYHKVKSRYKVWPSAYASGALVKCRKVGASNWGNSKKK